MQILDYSQVAIASTMMSLKSDKSLELSENFIRHLIINTVRRLYHTNKHQYGDMVIARDCRGKIWRKDVFPYYKSKRGKERDASFIDWERLYSIVDMIADELAETFPLAVVRVDGAEADDVIAVVARAAAGRENVLILSGDHDFIQLHSDSIRQHNPVAKTDVRHDAPRLYLVEHIIKGDSGDSVPNIISDADTFMIPGKRQRPMTAKRLEEYKNSINIDGFAYQEAYDRNRKLIDLSQIPAELYERIYSEFLAQRELAKGNGMAKIIPYMYQKGLKALIQDVGDFVAA